MISPKELNSLCSIYGTPAFYKEAEANPEGLKLASSAFADPGSREYPIDTPSSTYVSNLRYWNNSPLDPTSNPEIGQALMKAARFWGIDSHIKPVLAKVASELLKLAQAEKTAWALNTTGPNGEAVQLYSTASPEMVKMASEQFYFNRQNLPYAWRREIATNLLNKAAEFHVEFEPNVDTYLHQASGDGANMPKVLATALRKRAEILKNRRMFDRSAALLKTAEQINKSKPSKDLCEKVAMAMAVVDEETNLHKMYGSTLSMPEEIAFEVSTKAAQTKVQEYYFAPNGTSYKKADIEKVASVALAGSVFDTSIAGNAVDWDALHQQLTDATLESEFHDTVRAAGVVGGQLPAHFSGR